MMNAMDYLIIKKVKIYPKYKLQELFFDKYNYDGWTKIDE